MKIPKFKVGQGPRNLPYYKKKIWLKNDKLITIEEPRFSGLKCQLPKHFYDDQFWNYCNMNFKTDVGCDYQKRIAIVKIGRNVQKYFWLKYQVVNHWPFIKKRFTEKQLAALTKAANSSFDLNKPISLGNTPPNILIPGFQVNHEPSNGKMRLVSEIEHDGIKKNPHAGGMRLNNPEGFSDDNFASKQDWIIYNEQSFSWFKTLLFQLYIPMQNGVRYVIASLIKFRKITSIILILILFILLLYCVLFCRYNNCDPNSESFISYTKNIINTNNNIILSSKFQIINNISFFDFGESSITSYNEKELNFLIEKCKSDTTLHLIIYGCTCDIGSIEYNQSLSEQRANAVKQLLIQHCSLLKDRIDVIGLGELLPDSMKYTKRELNRRVDIGIKY